MSEVDSKAQTEFFIAKGEQNLGPWTVDQVAERVSRSEISITDHYYDDARQAWVVLMELGSLTDALRRLSSGRTQAPPPKTPPPMRQPPTQAATPVEAKAAAAEVPALTPVKSEPPPMQVATQPTPAPVLVTAPATTGPIIKVSPPLIDIDIPLPGREEPAELGEWFVQKGANRYGPLSYYGLVRSLQEKTVYDFDFVWKNGMETWVRIAEHKDFQPDRIRELASRLSSQKTEQAGPFFRRQFPRLPFSSEVIVHDDRSVWMGNSFEAGMGGSGLLIQNSALHPGQVIRLHFAPHDGLPAFNALGEIVGKRYEREVRGAKSPVRYAVRFLKLDGSLSRKFVSTSPIRMLAKFNFI